MDIVTGVNELNFIKLTKRNSFEKYKFQIVFGKTNSLIIKLGWFMKTNVVKLIKTKRNAMIIVRVHPYINSA